MKSDAKPSIAYGMLIVTVMIWGASYPVTKYALRFLPPFLLAFLRYGISALLFLPFCLGRNGIRRSDRKYILALGLSGSFFFVGFMNVGMRFTSGASGAFLSAAPPLLTTLLAAYFLGEGLVAQKITGLLIGLAGVVIVAGSPLGHGSPPLRMVGGNVLILCSLLSWATYTIIGRRLARRYPGEVIGAWTALAGSVLLLPLAVAERGWEIGYSITGGCIMAVLYLSLLNTALAYLLWNRALNVVGASTASSFQFLQPISGAFVSVTFLNEKPDLAMFGGAAIVILGVWKILRSDAPSGAGDAL